MKGSIELMLEPLPPEIKKIKSKCCDVDTYYNYYDKAMGKRYVFCTECHKLCEIKEKE